MPGPLAQLGRQRLADVGLVPVAEGVSVAHIGHLRPAPDGSFGGDDERVVARVGGVIGGQQRGQRIQVVGRLRDHAACRGHVRGVQRREPGVAAEDPEHADALVAAERRPLPVDGLLGPGDRRREADAVLGALHVVVHRLRDRQQRDPGVDQDLRVRQRVVTADRDQDVDAQRREVVEDERRQVEDPLADGVAGPLCRVHPGRHAGQRHLPRVRPRGVQDGAAGPLDGPRVDPVERPQVGVARVVAGPDVGQPLPPATDAEDRVARLGGAVDHALDDGVETGDVAAAGEDRDALRGCHDGRYPTATDDRARVAIRRRATRLRAGRPESVC